MFCIVVHLLYDTIIALMMYCIANEIPMSAFARCQFYSFSQIEVGGG